jgi:glycosyltransferase involved in cell wall biosynthesis
MRILLINSRHSMVGGAERVYFNTGNLLEEMGHEVQYFSTLEPSNIENSYSKYFVEVLNRRESGFLTRVASAKDYIYNKKAYSNLSALIEDCKPDIAHIHLFIGGLSSLILKALKKYDVPIVQTVHDYRHLCPANAFLNSKNEICEKCINKSYYQCSVKRCVDNNIFFSSMVTLEAYYRKYLLNPIDYIDNFIFVSRFSQLKHIEFDKRYSAKSSHLYNFTTLPDDQFSDKGHEGYYLFFGRLSKEKGIKTLLAAAEKSGFALKIVGNGPMYDEVVEFSKSHPNVQVLGHQSGEKLTMLIKNAYFILVPSECYEHNPMTILEAYALYKPVIGARIGGIPEIILEDNTGFLFESRNTGELINAIEKADKLNRTEYIEMCTKARSFAELNFSSVLHYRKLIQIYSKVVKNVK